MHQAQRLVDRHPPARDLRRTAGSRCPASPAAAGRSPGSSSRRTSSISPARPLAARARQPGRQRGAASSAARHRRRARRAVGQSRHRTRLAHGAAPPAAARARGPPGPRRSDAGGAPASGSAAASRACSAARPCRRRRRELPAEVEIGRRRGVEPAEQRAHVEAGAADDDRQRPRVRTAAIGAARVCAEARGVVALVGIDDVDQMMRHRRALLRRRLAGADVHAAVDLARVGADRPRWAAGARGPPRPRSCRPRSGPTTTSSGGLHAGHRLHSPRPHHVRSELPPDVAQGQPADDGAAVGAEVRRLRWREVREEARHLLALSGGWALMAARQATKASARSSSGVAAPWRRPTLVDQPLDEPLRARARSSVGTARSRTASRRSPRARSPGARASRSTLRAALALARRQLERLREQQLLRGERAARRARAGSRSNSTRSWATCWSRKNTSSSVAATMNVSWSWPTTRAEAARPVGRRRPRGRARPAPAGRTRPTGEPAAPPSAASGPRSRGSAAARAALRHARPARAAPPAPRGTTISCTSARRPEAHPRLGRVDVDVDLVRGHVDAQHGHREAVARQERPVGLEQRLGQERVSRTGRPLTIEHDLVAAAAGELGRARPAPTRGRRALRGPPPAAARPSSKPQQRADAVAQVVARAGAVRTGRPLCVTRKVRRRVRERELGHERAGRPPARSRAALRNLRRAGVLKKRSLHLDLVPAAAGTSSRCAHGAALARAPACPSAAPRGHERTAKRVTAQIAGSASPRKPSVAIASRSASVASLDVAWRARASVHLVGRHAEAVVGHADRAAARRRAGPRRPCGAAGVERVLDQLLHHRGRPLHDLARRDLVDEVHRAAGGCATALTLARPELAAASRRTLGSAPASGVMRPIGRGAARS